MPQAAFPDPTEWLLAAVPANNRSDVQSWAEWIVALTQLRDTEWSLRQRQEARDAFIAGRMARVPCGPPPTSLVDRDAAGRWLSWAALPEAERMTDKTWADHILPWSHVMASATGYKGTWRHPHIDAAALGILLTIRLSMLSSSPVTLMKHADTTDRQDRRKAVWRECVRIRQSLADMLPLTEDLPRSARGALKMWWFSSLEWTRLAEKEGEGMWNASVRLPLGSRIQVRWQRWFGKLAFR